MADRKASFLASRFAVGRWDAVLRPPAALQASSAGPPEPKKNDPMPTRPTHLHSSSRPKAPDQPGACSRVNFGGLATASAKPTAPTVTISGLLLAVRWCASRPAWHRLFRPDKRLIRAFRVGGALQSRVAHRALPSKGGWFLSLIVFQSEADFQPRFRQATIHAVDLLWRDVGRLRGRVYRTVRRLRAEESHVSAQSISRRQSEAPFRLLSLRERPLQNMRHCPDFTG